MMVCATFLFASMGVCVKLASAWYGTGEIVMYRGLIGLLLMGALTRWQGVSLRTTVPGMHFWRSISGVTALCLWFYSISGLPLATGAAVACPDRKVVLLQADGSGMYTVQALWTQARERLDCLTIIYANRTYATLHGEMKNVGVIQPGENAKRMLDLVDPHIDWVQVSQGLGVEAVRVDTVEGFTQAMRAALARKGPFLIEAVI